MTGPTLAAELVPLGQQLHRVTIFSKNSLSICPPSLHDEPQPQHDADGAAHADATIEFGIDRLFVMTRALLSAHDWDV